MGSYTINTLYSDGFPIHIDTTSMGLPILYFKGPQVEVSYDVFLSLKVVLILANSADPDEMQHYAAFLLGLHCLLGTHYGVSGLQRVM